MNRTIGDLVAKNQSIASRLQNSLDRLAGVNAENQSLKAALNTSASASAKPANIETCCQHRGNVPLRQFLSYCRPTEAFTFILSLFTTICFRTIKRDYAKLTITSKQFTHFLRVKHILEPETGLQALRTLFFFLLLLLEPKPNFLKIPDGWKETSADIRLSRMIAINKNTAGIRLTASIFF